uniref:Uncharacterized protein n=1 Tax=Rhizophora mucronata TaxID=61149 RepID=A0A2P2K9V0_RHIMU
MWNNTCGNLIISNDFMRINKSRTLDHVIVYSEFLIKYFFFFPLRNELALQVTERSKT